MTKQGGFEPFESYDGRTIYYSRFYQAGIWSVPASGGTESLVIADKPQVGYWGYWGVTRSWPVSLERGSRNRAPH